MACMSVCPTKAITLQKREEGFIYPSIIQEKCISCNACINICPVNKGLVSIEENIECYAAMATDEVRFASSSGGVFTIAARYFIKNGGYVCGASYISDFKVEHIVISNLNEIPRLQKAKYIQSNITNCIRQLKELVNKNEQILFTGTPCQCSAIQSLFSDYDALFYIDILCMGVPSQDCFDKYIQEEFENSKIESFDFRDKNYGWSQNLHFKIKTSKKEVIRPFHESSYFTAFLKGLTIRDCCFDCHFAGKKRTGDITIGDCWGIHSYNPSLDDKKGTSLLLVNTQKGRTLFSDIQKDFIQVDKIPFKTAQAGNITLKKPNSENPKRKIFKINYENKSLKQNLEDIINDTADCAILNYWYTNDHGAILTAYALQRLLFTLGYTSKLINIAPPHYISTRNGGISQNFELQYLDTTFNIYNTADKLKSLNNKFKVFLVGSDQVFRAEWVGNDWFLQFVDINTPKIAISASFGTNTLNVTKARKRQLAWLLNRFNAISVREKDAIAICKSNGGVAAFWILDPVFLVDINEYTKLLPSSPVESNYCFVYIRDPAPEQTMRITEFAQVNNLKIIWNHSNLPVEDFLSTLYYAACIITDSYHGLCFSLIFHKSVICYYNEKRGGSRFDTLIQLLPDINDIFIHDNNAELEIHQLDYSKIHSAINCKKETDIKWIYEQLKNPPPISKLRCYLFYMRTVNIKTFVKDFTHKLINLWR